MRLCALAKAIKSAFKMIEQCAALSAVTQFYAHTGF